MFAISYGPIKYAINRGLGEPGFKPLDEKIDDLNDVIEAVDATGGTTTTGGANAKLNNILERVEDLIDLLEANAIHPLLTLKELPIGAFILDVGSSMIPEPSANVWEVIAKNHYANLPSHVTLATRFTFGNRIFAPTGANSGRFAVSSIRSSLRDDLDNCSEIFKANILASPIEIFQLDFGFSTIFEEFFQP